MKAMIDAEGRHKRGICERSQKCRYTHTHIHSHIRTHTRVSICTRIQRRRHTGIHTCIHPHAHTCSRIHTHTHTHTHKHKHIKPHTYVYAHPHKSPTGPPELQPQVPRCQAHLCQLWCVGRQRACGLGSHAEAEGQCSVRADQGY